MASRRASCRPAALSGKAIREAKTPQRPIGARLPSRPSRSGPPTCPTSIPRPRSSPSRRRRSIPAALKREVFGFLPYWELSDSSTRYDWEKLSTVAYFGVGAAGDGNLQKRNSDGSTTVGWSGWTSSKMTSVINAAHASGARVVLTVQSFAWSSAGVARQKSLLGSSGNRANLARQIAAAVRDRGADGVNLDFEPIVATYADEFTSLVRAVRSELNKVHSGYQLTFDTTGWIGNYPIEKATASGGADAVVVMGYDYRGGSSNPVGSVAPIAGPTYDIGDTVARLHGPHPGLEGHPRRAVLRPRLVDGHLGAPREEHLGHQVRRVDDRRLHHRPPVRRRPRQAPRPGRGRGLDRLQAPELHRQVRLRDAVAGDLLRRRDGARAEVRPRQPRRTCAGAGIWALGYDGTRTELYAMLKAKFITDTVPPVISASSISGPFVSANGDGRMDTVTVRATVTGHIKFGWSVARLVGRRRRAGDPERERHRQDRRLHLGRSRRRRQARRRRPVPDHRLGRRRLEQPGLGRQGRDRGPPPRDRRPRLAPVVPVTRRQRSRRHDRPGHPRRRGRHRHRADPRQDGRDGPALDADRPPPPRTGPGTAATRAARSSPTGATRSGSSGLDRAGNQTVARPRASPSTGRSSR